MGKCEISRKVRSRRELNFLRQLQICAFPQPGEGPSEVVSRGSPLPRRLRRARGPAGSDAAGRGTRGSPPPPRRGPGNLPACKTARYSRAMADARANNRTFISPLLFLLFSFIFPFLFFFSFFLCFVFLVFFRPKLVWSRVHLQPCQGYF